MPLSGPRAKIPRPARPAALMGLSLFWPGINAVDLLPPHRYNKAKEGD